MPDTDVDVPDTNVDVELQYSQLRKEALKAATERIQGQGSKNIQLRTIDREALLISRSWTKSSMRTANWDWFEKYRFSKFHHPKRFEVAIWETGTLLCLSIGQPEYQGMVLRLNLVELSPPDLGDRPANIGEHMILAYDIYARLINAKQIRLVSPGSRVMATYEKYGFQYFAPEDFLFRNIIS